MKLKRVIKKNPHEHDDYTVFVFPNCNIAVEDPICYYCTVHFLRAIKMYLKYSREFPQATIVFKHAKYY